MSNSSADAADASEWLQKAATSGDAIATFMLERANWSPTKTTADHTMLWGSSRYNDVGFEGWGRLPLADFSDLDAASLIQLAEEHSLLPTGFGTSVDQQQQQQHILSCCREALTPRFVITLHEDPWIGEITPRALQVAVCICKSNAYDYVRDARSLLVGPVVGVFHGV